MGFCGRPDAHGRGGRVQLGNVFGLGNARLIATDGKGGMATDTRPVTVGNISGDWSGTISGAIQFRASLQQASNGNVTATWSANCGGVPVTGILDPAAANRIDGNANCVIRLKITGGGGPGGFSDFTIDGRMDTSTGNTLTGGARGSGFNGNPAVLARQ